MTHDIEFDTRNRPDSILGFVSGSSVKIWFMYSVFNLFKKDFDQRFAADWLLVYGPYIHKNRNQLVDEFLATDRDWLFMVDNDIVFTPEDVWSVFEVADEKGPGVYAGAYLLEDGSLVCGPWEPTAEYAYHPMLALPAKPTNVGVVGAGFTLVHRKVYEEIENNWYSEPIPGIGEDVSFSWRAREAGYTPWLVPKANPGHFKELVLYPHNEVRNMVGENVNLVEAISEVNMV